MKKILTVGLIILFFCPMMAMADKSTDRRIFDADGVLLDLDANGYIQISGGGDAADSATTANPLVVGGKAESTVPTEVSDGDAVYLWTDTFGKQLIYGANQSVGAIDVNPIAQEPIGSGSINIVPSTQLDDSPTSYTSSAVFVGDKKKIAFITKAVEVDPGGAVDPQVAWTVDVSFDGTTFYTGLDVLFDSNGTDGPVASVTQNPGGGNTTYEFFYLPEGFTAQYLRLVGTCGANCDADEYITVTSYLQYQK